MLPNARHLILNLLLGAGGQALSARTAVAACALFGLRENSVRVALTRLAAAGMVESVGRGEHAPIADNATAKGRAANRRIEIIITPAAD